MINVIKVILYRMIKSKSYLVMPIFIIPIVIACSIYFSSSFVTKANIGIVGDYNINFNSEEINIIKLQNKVMLSDLAKNKYDAVISFEDGKAVVDTIKGNDFKNKVEKTINGESVTFKDGEKRGVAANIIGYITMFVILLGVMLYRFFLDDKRGIAKRIISANISYGQYILSHLISVFIIIFIPTSIVTVLCKELFHLDTTVTIFQLIFIILILSLLSSAFGLLISSSVKEMQSASMLGVMINIITTLFAGSFFTVSNNNLITKIGSLLPQKHILDFTIALENNDVITYGNVASVIAITIIMIFCSFLINKYKSYS